MTDNTETTLDPVEALASLPSFKEINPSILKSLTEQAILRKYEPGQIIFLQGQPCDGLYIVQEGRVKGFKQAPTGREQVVGIMGPGEVFNDIALLAVGNTLLTVQALEKSLVWIIQREPLLHLMETNAQLCLLITQNMARHAYRMLNLIEDLSLRKVEDRLAHWLLQQSNDGMIKRYQWATHAQIAAQIGSVPGVVSRILHNFINEGLIRIEHRQIYILDSPGLEAKVSHNA